MKEPGKGERLDDATLTGLESVLRAACGMVLAPSVRSSLGTALTRAAEAFGLPPQEFLHRLLARDTVAVESFIGYAVIGETYFFRHPEQMRELARLAAAHIGPFQVWSAGCASGEEPYSLAMALLTAGLHPEHIRVLGTDVSGRALDKARQGIYSPWSVRRMERALEKRYLTIRPDAILVPAQVRARVEFRRHNLVTDPPPLSGAQAIFCRNVLIYFPTEVIPGVLERLLSALAPGGWLFLAPAELPFTRGLGLEEQTVDGMPVLRKPLHPGVLPPRLAEPQPPSRRQVARAAGTSRRGTPPPRRAVAEPQVAPGAPPGADAARGAHDALAQARAAVRAGHFEQAEAYARQAASELSPDAYLLLAMVAEERGDAPEAVACLRKALYLEPQLAIGHAMLVALYGQLGQSDEAERARRNALRALEGLDDELALRGVEEMTVGGLRRALVPGVKLGKSGSR